MRSGKPGQCALLYSLRGAHEPVSTLSLNHQCPQCGAPVELEETERVFACPFCAVRLFIHAHGPLQYYIKPRIHAPGTLIYVPYWRLRGTAYVLDSESMQHKILDSSLLASTSPCLPPSLGLRSQALRLHFVEPETPGYFLRPGFPSTVFKKKLLNAVPGLRPVHGPKLTSCVGDALSLVFLPVFQDQEITDGLTGALLGPACIAEADLCSSEAALHFISTLCPRCGWDLQGDTKSLVQACLHCDTVWEAQPHGCTAVEARFLESKVTPTRYLPFWNLRFKATGFKLDTWADLIRLTYLPRVIQPWMESTPFSFRVPAFKIQPALFLRLSAQVSLYQPSISPRDTLPRVPLHPVTLPKEEGMDAVPVLLGKLAPTPKLLFPKIHHGRLAPLSATLDYIPFTEDTKEFLQPEMNMAIQKNALLWSTTL